jgi:hypothetical protein
VLQLFSLRQHMCWNCQHVYCQAQGQEQSRLPLLTDRILYDCVLDRVSQAVRFDLTGVL